jgi:DNA-binding phage protein
MEASSAVPRYNLAAPSEQDLFVSLNRLMKPEESQKLWTTACRSTGARSPMSIEQFERTLVQLKEAKGMASIAASSMLVRLKSYRTLSKMHPK